MDDQPHPTATCSGVGGGSAHATLTPTTNVTAIGPGVGGASAHATLTVKQADRLSAAASSAIEAIAAKEATEINPDVFAEIGNALHWLYALGARGRGGSNSLLSPGFTYARNQSAHGNLVSDFSDWQYGPELGRLRLGNSRLGAKPQLLWRSDVVVLMTPRQANTKGCSTTSTSLASRS